MPKTASESEIRQAYLKLARKHHPDKDGSDDATKIFQKLQGAYELLSDPDNRRKHDRVFTALQPAKTPLMEAAGRADAEEVERLLAAGAAPDARDPAGRTALMCAARSLCRRSVAALLRAGADPNARNCAGWTAALFCAGAGAGYEAPPAPPGGGALECVQELIQGRASLDAGTTSNVTALMMACMAGNLEVVQLLIKSGANPNLVTDIGLTTLVFAADKGNCDVVRLLLAERVDVHSRYRGGKTALMSACMLAHEDVVSLLLEANSDPNARAEDGSTALLYASKLADDGLVCPAETQQLQKLRSAAVARHLLAARADPKAETIDGRTPIRLAMEAGNRELIRVLVAAGADPFSPASDGKCAMTAVGLRSLSFGAFLVYAKLTASGWLSCAPGGCCPPLETWRAR